MFSSKYLTILAKIRALVVTHADDNHWRWRRWLCTDRNKPFISLICCTLFADLQMPTPFRILFQACSSLGNADGEVFLWQSAVKGGADLNTYITPSQLHVQYRSSLWKTIVFVKGQSVTQKLLFVVRKHFLVHLVRWRTFETRKSTRMLVRRWKGSFREQVGNLFLVSILDWKW